MQHVISEVLPKVLITDDDPAARVGVRTFLEANGFSVLEAADCASAELEFRRSSPHLVVLDHQLPDGTALDLLPRLRRLDAQVSVIVVTGYGSIDLAVSALKEGAEHFLTKPVAMPVLLTILERAIENRRRRQRQLAGDGGRTAVTFDPFAGGSAAVTVLRERAYEAAGIDLPIVIQGETGSGKGVLARWLHDHGPRRAEVLVELNCAGLPRELAEAELFGHERGAFTGAVTSKPGLLEAAHQGTVLLDEIAEMDLLVQAKLLKVVEDKRVRRLGDIHERQADIRLLAATNASLKDLVRTGRFRADLYYRLQRLELRVPPLRERPEDIPILARAIVVAFAAELGRSPPALTPETERALSKYTWPGNIRELRNVVERGVLFARGGTLEIAAELLTSPDVKVSVDADSDGLTLRDILRRHIERVVWQQGGNIGRAATILGVSRSTLYHKIRALRIPHVPS